MKKFYMLALVATLAMPVITHAEDAPTPPSVSEGKGPKGEGRDHKGRMEEHFKKVDTDGDGAISKAEFLKEAENKFAKLDTNGDGKITKEEREAAREKFKAEHPRGPRGEGKGPVAEGGPKDAPTKAE